MRDRNWQATPRLFHALAGPSRFHRGQKLSADEEAYKSFGPEDGSAFVPRKVRIA
jgi:hypothetical protein